MLLRSNFTSLYYSVDICLYLRSAFARDSGIMRLAEASLLTAVIGQRWRNSSVTSAVYCSSDLDLNVDHSVRRMLQAAIQTSKLGSLVELVTNIIIESYCEE